MKKVIVITILILFTGCVHTNHSSSPVPEKPAFDRVEKGKRVIDIGGELVVVEPSVRKAGEFLAEILERQWRAFNKPEIILHLFQNGNRSRNLLCQQLEDYISSHIQCRQTNESLEQLVAARISQSSDAEIKPACYLTGTLYLMENDGVIDILIKGMDIATRKPVLTARCCLDYKNSDVQSAWDSFSNVKVYAGFYKVWDNNKKEEVRRTSVSMKSREGFKIYVKPTETLYVYMVNFDSAGNGISLFPNQCNDDDFMKNPIPAGREIWFPKEKPFRLDDFTGKEMIYIYASRNPLPDIQYMMENDLSDVCGRTKLSASGKSTDEIRGVFKEYAAKGVYKETHSSTMVKDNTDRISRVRARLMEGNRHMLSQEFIIDHRPN